MKHFNNHLHRLVAAFLVLPILVGLTFAAVSVQTPVLLVNGAALIDPQAETPTNAREVTLNAVGSTFYTQNYSESRTGLRVIRDFAPGNALNLSDPTILDSSEVDFKFSYSGAVATSSNSFQISNNSAYQTSYGSSVSLKGISNNSSPLTLRIDIGTWSAGVFTPGTVEALAFTLSGPFGRLAGDAATITYHAPDDSVIGGNPVLCCPEMTYAVGTIPELLIDPLPADVKPHVIWRDTYWLTAEAASVYSRAAAIVSFEMHSPIVAIANGVPALYLRQPTDTSKGYIWPHIGLGDWFFEIDTATGTGIAAAVLSSYGNPGAARSRVRAASGNPQAA